MQRRSYISLISDSTIHNTAEEIFCTRYMNTYGMNYLLYNVSSIPQTFNLLTRNTPTPFNNPHYFSSTVYRNLNFIVIKIKSAILICSLALLKIMSFSRLFLIKLLIFFKISLDSNIFLL